MACQTDRHVQGLTFEGQTPISVPLADDRLFLQDQEERVEVEKLPICQLEEGGGGAEDSLPHLAGERDRGEEHVALEQGGGEQEAGEEASIQGDEGEDTAGV